MKSLVKVSDHGYETVSGSMANALPSGVYQVKYNGMSGITSFESKITNNDKIVDLPGTAFDKVTKEIDEFLLPSTKEKFAQKGFLYKRSFLLHGLPGCGKSVLVSRLMEKVIAIGGVVLLPTGSVALATAFDTMKHTNSETLTLVVLEEFDEQLQESEANWLLLLDGEIQMRNVIYVATTNHLDKIPQRVLRPGRFSSIVEVGWPGLEARKAYLATKFDHPATVSEWASITEGLSIDEIKEVVLAVECLGQNRSDVIKKVERIKKATANFAEYKSTIAEALGQSDDGDTLYFTERLYNPIKGR